MLLEVTAALLSGEQNTEGRRISLLLGCLNVATFRSRAAERERYARKPLCVVDSVLLTRSQLCQKPGSCGQALHGMRSLWWSWTASLTLFSFSSFLSLPLSHSLLLSSLLLPPFLMASHYLLSLRLLIPFQNLWTREAELISCQAAASGYCVHCHRVKGFLGFWACHYSTQHQQHYSVYSVSLPTLHYSVPAISEYLFICSSYLSLLFCASRLSEYLTESTDNFNIVNLLYILRLQWFI